MVVKSLINDTLPSIWPMVVFICVVCIVLRCTYLFRGNHKLILHKELFNLVFIIYILCLYYILMYKNTLSSGINLIPFKVLSKYKFGSYSFFKVIVSNILVFLPFGYFASHYISNRKSVLIMLVTLLVSASSSLIVYYLDGIFNIDNIILNVIGGFCGYLLYVALNAIKGKLPKFMKSDTFINIVIIILIVLLVLFSMDINVLNYL